MEFEIVPLGSFGAEVVGLNLGKNCNEIVIKELRYNLSKHQFLLFRNQAISPQDQNRITSYFGSFEPSILNRPTSHQVPGHPNILHLNNLPGSPTVKYGFSWHSDGLAYAKVPHGVTILYCLDCPTGTGDTLFANQYEAYKAMPVSLRNLVKDLYWYLPTMPYSEVKEGKRLLQPIVRIHPVTQQEFLFIAPNACEIRGMSINDGGDLLNTVRRFQTDDKLIYRHSWNRRDLILWENCTLLHNRADNVSFEEHGLRSMYRSATKGSFSAIECDLS